MTKLGSICMEGRAMESVLGTHLAGVVHNFVWQGLGFSQAEGGECGFDCRFDLLEVDEIRAGEYVAALQVPKHSAHQID